MLLTVLRFNFASPQGEPSTQSRLLSAALELAQWGESRGITSVSVDEHHATGQGWSCNPIMAAAMFLARTSVEPGPASRRHRAGRQHEPGPTAHHGRPGLPNRRI